MKLRLLDQTALFDLKCSRDVLSNLEIPGFPPIPDTPNTRTELNGHEIYWVGDKHFLFRTKLSDEKLWHNSLKQIEERGLISQSLVSDIYNFFEFNGEDVIEFLASITSLDLANLANSSSCFSHALGIKTLFIRRELGFELAFEHCYLEMVREQFYSYL